MKAMNPWITYRTRFVVNARQLTASLTFTDSLGRQHSGRKGDYLVESDGVLRIQPRQIFEDIYVPLSADDRQPEQISPPNQTLLHRQFIARGKTPLPVVLSPLARKSPQPYHDRRSSTPGLRSL